MIDQQTLGYSEADPCSFVTVTSTITSTITSTGGPRWNFCPNCGRALASDWKFCPGCATATSPTLGAAWPVYQNIYPAYPNYIGGNWTYTAHGGNNAAQANQ